jgi:hypothetical protein
VDTSVSLTPTLEDSAFQARELHCQHSRQAQFGLARFWATDPPQGRPTPSEELVRRDEGYRTKIIQLVRKVPEPRRLAVVSNKEKLKEKGSLCGKFASPGEKSDKPRRMVEGGVIVGHGGDEADRDKEWDR